MKLDVKVFATLRLKLGRGSIPVEIGEPISILKLLKRIDEETQEDVSSYLLEDDGTLKVGTMILVGGKNIHHLDGLETTVTDEDIAIFPPAGGG